MDDERAIVTQVLPQIARNLQELLPRNWEWAIMAIPKTLELERIVLFGSSQAIEDLIKPEVQDEVGVSESTELSKRGRDNRGLRNK